MTNIEKSRVAEIIKLHNEVYSLLKTSLEKALRIGELLAEQKKSLKHGEWLLWIKANLPFSERAAQRYMGVYYKQELIKSANVSDLNSAYRLLEAPKQADDLLYVNADDIEPNPFFDMSYIVPESVGRWVNVLATRDYHFPDKPYWITAVRRHNDKYQNLCDHNRLVAIKMLNVKSVPIVIVANMDDKKTKSVLEFDLREFQEAEEYRRLLRKDTELEI